jgi:tetraacyldisaccharide 4'-kinase
VPAEPSWWYERRRGVAATLLRPLGAMYGAAVQWRIRTTPPYVSRLPVICVGNFTAGGTGKTPLSRHIATLLGARGARVAILSRGYGGRTSGPHWVDREADSAATVGDEPLLLAATVPVMVARDRVAGARAIEADRRAFTHILMDDGLQNPSLQKSLSLAVVDGARGVGNGFVIPAGPLRAPLAFQFGLTTAIVINHGAAAADDNITAKPAFAMLYKGPAMAAYVEPDRASIDALRGQPLIAFAGIGVPDKFFAMLRAAQLDVCEAIAFPDHHAFTDADVGRLQASAARAQARLVTTEKDATRLSGLARPLDAAVVPIHMILSAHDATRLDALLAPLLHA